METSATIRRRRELSSTLFVYDALIGGIPDLPAGSQVFKFAFDPQVLLVGRGDQTLQSRTRTAETGRSIRSISDWRQIARDARRGKGRSQARQP
jgi:hypothetical protein